MNRRLLDEGLSFAEIISDYYPDLQIEFGSVKKKTGGYLSPSLRNVPIISSNYSYRQPARSMIRSASALLRPNTAAFTFWPRKLPNR